MTRNFKQWLKQGLKATKDENGHGVPPEPPYREYWPNLPASSANTKLNYGLFQRLPLEVRQQILTQAFGKRTLHVHLAYDHPLARKPNSGENKRRMFLSKRADEKRPENRRRHCGLGSNLVPDASRPKQWQWFSCVCHRRVVEARECRPEPQRPPQGRIEPCNDGCLNGRLFTTRYTTNAEWGRLCRCEPIAEYDRPMADRECFIGIMGWLLACRQAYIEGVDILYRTNTFHMSSLPLLLNLARLMPPRRLATITSVELLWDLFDDRETIKTVYKQAQASPSSVPPQSQPSTKFHELRQITPRIFPNARNVYVAVQAPIEPLFWAERPAACLPLLERAILGPVEDMFRAMGPEPEKEFSFAIQLGGFLALARRHWRDKDVDPGVYRRAPSQCAVDESGYFVLDGVSFRAIRAWRPLGPGGAGYWLRPGLTDSWTAGLGMFDIWGTWDDLP
ncbi:hypothetical protein MYCTH_2303064 [Thermothelomyces thermophilus ATCC 42464]|uniref:DUF7730 domain-containing protein n=1 Tax=Thermothelomyces thermophilus (strain ATCC 42464 / BCRC 31852 / DSM 1799) TaxID=573729 RepID=G2Q9B0_THET4|nr:uncharacterized protein MYCTH_2303064 [Thermothelomyces thermophilus ATCC 42464]AEO57202.1 hypothetical protein MYCTH_2303064 [Thermothelomyces thermophilus ATCC 42464]